MRRKGNWLGQEVFITILILNREICVRDETLDRVIDKIKLEIVSDNRIMGLRMIVQVFMRIEIAEINRILLLFPKNPNHDTN